jgi:DNA-binding IclR family transcriptional regulator
MSVSAISWNARESGTSRRVQMRNIRGSTKPSMAIDVSIGTAKKGQKKRGRAAGERRDQRSWAEIPKSAVKSAARVLQILEYFDDVQRDATLNEIAVALRYPPSSTAALLRSLVSMGYLDFSAAGYRYSPTERVRLLGTWINDRLFEEANILKLVGGLYSSVDETVVLAVRHGLSSQVIHVRSAKVAPCPTPGMLCPIVDSMAGLVLLSACTKDEVAQIVKRLNADAATDGRRLCLTSLRARLEEIRTKGYGFAQSTQSSEGVLAVLLPEKISQRPLVIAVCGAWERMTQREEEIVRSLHAGFDRAFQ